MMRKAARQRRQWLYAWHKWLGISLGFVFVLLGLTGSLLVFYQELDNGFQHGKKAPEISLTSVVKVLNLAEPQRDGPWRIEMPTHAGALLTARYMKPVETAGQGFAPLILRLHPESLTVKDRYFWGAEFWTWIYDLHYSLKLGTTGSTLLGVVALLLLLLTASGLYLWWPRLSQFRQAITIKPGAVWKRRVYDLHVKPGAYMALLMIVIILTGLILVVPAWFKPGISMLSPLTPPTRPVAVLPVTQAFISGETAIREASRHFTAAEIRWIETPSPTQPFWRIQMRQNGEPNRRFPRSQIWVDAQTGETLAIRDPKNNTIGDSIFDWLHPLHNGEALGLAGRIAVFMAGLMPLLAFVTGLIRLGHKRQGKETIPDSQKQVF